MNAPATTDKLPNFWDKTHPLSTAADRLWNDLVPQSGAASTTHGELLRLTGRLIYDFYNNGSCNMKCEELLAAAGLAQNLLGDSDYALFKQAADLLEAGFAECDDALRRFDNRCERGWEDEDDHPSCYPFEGPREAEYEEAHNTLHALATRYALSQECSHSADDEAPAPLKFTGIAAEGDCIKAFDFEPRAGGPDRYIIGTVVNPDVMHHDTRCFKVVCVFDSFWPAARLAGASDHTGRLGHFVYVPHEISPMEYDGRVSLVRANS